MRMRRRRGENTDRSLDTYTSTLCVREIVGSSFLEICGETHAGQNRNRKRKEKGETVARDRREDSRIEGSKPISSRR